MPEQPGWDPDEGVSELSAPAAEIDITDAALARGTADEPSRAATEAHDPAAWAAGGEDESLSAAAQAQGEGSFDAAEPDSEADQPAPAPEDDAPTPPLRKILESILLVVDQPVPEVELAQVLEAPRATVLAALEDLAGEYDRDGRGFELRQVAGGWRLYTTPDCAPYVERFVLEGQQARLTQAALETLAVVAYRQPVSRQSIAAIRGVNVDGVIRTLLTRGLIAEAGQEGPGGAHLYVTTPYFLERLGVRSLDELPNLAPLLPMNIDDLAGGA